MLVRRDLMGGRKRGGQEKGEGGGDLWGKSPLGGEPFGSGRSEGKSLENAFVTVTSARGGGA